MASDKQKEYCRKYYQTHKEELKAKANARNALRSADNSEYGKKYYKNNKEARKAYSKAYYEAHKENIRARQYIYYQNHLSKTNEAKEKHLNGFCQLSKDAQRAVDAFLKGRIREKKLLAILAEATSRQMDMIDSWRRDLSERTGLE